MVMSKSDLNFGYIMLLSSGYAFGTILGVDRTEF